MVKTTIQPEQAEIRVNHTSQIGDSKSFLNFFHFQLATAFSIGALKVTEKKGPVFALLSFALVCLGLIINHV